MTRSVLHAFLTLFISALLALTFLKISIIKNWYRIEYRCSDFKTQKQAQKIYDQNDKDIYQLDRDHDKVACEDLP